MGEQRGTGPGGASPPAHIQPDESQSRKPKLVSKTVAGYEWVSRFNYLGSVVTNIWKNNTDIWKHNHNITKNTKLSPLMRQKLEPSQCLMSFEMWVYRRMMRLPWTAHRTNISILTEPNITARLTTITKTC